MTSEPNEHGTVRAFTVHAIEVDIVLNKFGLHVPEGAMYVLDEHLDAVVAVQDAIDAYRDAVEPLFRDVLCAVETSDGSVVAVRDSVREVIDEHERAREVIDDYEKRVPEAYRDEVESAYAAAVTQLREAIRESHETSDDLREAVTETITERRESVPEQLNPLDDAYSLLEEDERKDPSLIQPLVIRANEGDTIEIEFVNHLDRRASIHQTSLPYDVRTSDGMAVGRNPDTTAPPNEEGSVTYRWEAAQTGTHFFYDGANQAFDSASVPPQKGNLLARGLFGAVVVEPNGATWTDPQTGGELRSGVRADIHDPNLLDTNYREFVIFYHSPVGTTPDVAWPTNEAEEQSIHAINYRSDPSGQRINEDCPDCDTEKLFYHSWTNGDPGGGDSVYTAYKGDPVKFCFVGASHEENHVHHLHQHRYKEIPPTDTETEESSPTDAATVDAQTIGLGDCHEAYLVAGHGPGTVRPDMDFGEAFDVGAGYTHGTAGDVLFHCHLFPHYAEGMWGSMRVLDREQEFLEPLDQTDVLADDELDPDDLPLPSGKIIGANADEEAYPSFPAFVGDAIERVENVDDPIGYGAPKPPNLTVSGSREPTEMEERVLGSDPLPGAPYADPTRSADGEETASPVNRIVEYTIAVMPAEIAYNDAGEHDPDGIVYALEEVNVSPGPGRTEDDVVGTTDGTVKVEDAERIRSGELNPEPLFLRANVGDRVDVRLRDELTTIEMAEEEHPFDASIHPHYVGYDVLGSDSLSNGFNYYQGTSPDEINESRWYADEEGTIYFHDHIFAIKKGVHGMFCGLVVEPEGSEWRDPYSGDPVYSGAQADILTPDDCDAPDFREQALHYHDFAPLRKPDGDRLNRETEHAVNKGTMAINYRNAPYYNRDSDDPAYVHSSAVHGDPPTPVLEAYDGDPIRFRVFQGCYEEQHTFSVHGLRTERALVPTENSVSKYLGTSEAFTFEIASAETTRDEAALTNPDGLPVRDHLYASNVVDDLWTGMWGLVRLWGGTVDHLRPLPDGTPPTETLSDSDLREMGHPAPYSDIDWTDEGQRAKHIYSLADETSLLDSAVDALDDIGDAVLSEAEVGEEFGRRVQKRLRDSGVYDTPLVPANIDARRNSAVGDRPSTPASDGATPGAPGPSDADIREYDVTAFATEIPYNDYGDHDPHGVVFALDRYVDEIKAGERAPEPLFLRVNEGERLRINLTNDLPPHLDNDHPHPKMLIQRDWERSDRVSLHPLELEYDVNGSDGAAVGFNYDTTVGPGDTLSYEWYADGAVGAVCLWDMADVRSTRHHGAFGQVFVEPPNAITLTPDTAEPVSHGSAALVKTPSGQADFREHGLLFADSQYVVNRFDPTDCVVPRAEWDGGEGEPEGDGESELPPCTQTPDDTEDQGYGGVNYRSEPFDRRFRTNDAQHLVYSSSVHGDPSTPVHEAFLGDPVRFRVGCAADKARAITFHLAGHQWERFRGVDGSPRIGTDGQFGPGAAESLALLGGAGGRESHPGDYIYQETKQRRRLESGLWGIFRVHDDPTEGSATEQASGSVQPLPDRADDIALENRAGFVIEQETDFTGSGTPDIVVGVPESDIGAANAGGVYVFEDASPGEVTDLAAADLQILGEKPNRRVGIAIDSKQRPTDEGADIVVGTATGRRVIPGGTKLRDLIGRVEEGGPPSSDIAAFVTATMPTGEWPVVPLSHPSLSEV